MNILIISAIEKELNNILLKISQISCYKYMGKKIVSGKLYNRTINILISGPGIVNAAHTLTYAIIKLKPNLIILSGCAGSFAKSDLYVGDIAVATKEIDVHLGIEPENSLQKPKELPFYIINNSIKLKNIYPLDIVLAESAFSIINGYFKNIDVAVKTGPFITVSQITATKKTADYYYKKYTPCMESMEGSAIAHIAILYKIPLIEIRASSNLVGIRDKDQWNLDLAFKRSSKAVSLLIKEL
jgi:futalosine hydrolase